MRRLAGYVALVLHCTLTETASRMFNIHLAPCYLNFVNGSILPVSHGISRFFGGNLWICLKWRKAGQTGIISKDSINGELLRYGF